MRFARTGQLLRIAIRNVRRSHLHTVLAVTAALTGTGGLTVCIGYAAAGREKILYQFQQMGTNLIIVTPAQSRAVGGRARTGTIVTTLRETDFRALMSGVPDISEASPTASTVLRVRAGDLTKNTPVIGCAPEYFAIRHWRVRMGTLFEKEDGKRAARVAVLGATAARDLFGQEDPTGRRLVIGSVPFTIAGVLAERGQGLDAANEDSQIYVPLETAMHRLINVDYFTSILLQVDKLSAMDSTASMVAEVLSQRHRVASQSEADFQVQNQKALLDTQLAAFARLTFFLRWIAACTLTVASLGIFGVAWIGVGQRIKEIGTRRAMGATAIDILTQFFAEGITGPIIGCGVGMVAAWFTLRTIDSRVGQPFIFSGKEVVEAAALSLALYAASTLLCCARAIRVEPSVALRAE
jgi:putative ABC transport system permease protein